jgi:flagellar L-ring protein precursor FlgH
VRSAVFSRFGFTAVLLGLLIPVAAEAGGPSSSLFGNPGRRQPLTLADYSWTYPQEVDEIRLNDLITVIVDEKSAVISEGEMDRKKKAYGDLILKDWVLLKGLAAIPDPQSLGDPHIRGEVDNKMRSEAELQTRDSMKFRISCRVVDIRPNGNLVIEGRRTVQNNGEIWEQSLTGEVRPKDVLPNNTVLSENVAELRIAKRESGHVRDGYRRGWLLRWLDKWQPF